MHLLNDLTGFDSLRYYNSQSDVTGRSKIVSTQNQNNFTLEHLHPSHCSVKTHYAYYDTTYFTILPLQWFHVLHVSNPFSFKKSC